MISLIREHGIFRLKSIPFNNITFVFADIDSALKEVEEINKK